MTLNNQETATVLAALRHWQDQLESYDGDPSDPSMFSGHFNDESEKPLNPGEIDTLCEKINMPEPVKILIELDGGLIECITATDPVIPLVIDHDLDGAEKSQVKTIDWKNSIEVVYVYRGPNNCKAEIDPELVEKVFNSAGETP